MIYLDLTQLIHCVSSSAKTILLDGTARSTLEFALGLIENKNVEYICAGNGGYIKINKNFVKMFADSKPTPLFRKYIKFYKVNTVGLREIMTYYKESKVKMLYHITRNCLQRIIAWWLVPRHNCITMKNGDTIISPNFVTLLHGSWSLEAARLHAKINVVSIIHDVIPILYPSFTSLKFLNQMESFFEKFHDKIDLYLANSKHTEKDLKEFLASKYGIADPKTAVIKWGFSITDSSNAIYDVPLIGGNYIMYVSTFGPRKNHIKLFEAWSEIVKSGKSDGWKLICVGQKDKKYSEPENYIQKNLVHLGSTIQLLHHIGGDAIINLYKNCRFTVYPSLYEGYGMPIAESIYYGKVCITSNVSSMPEVGGEYADYINPESTDEIRDKILHYITNPDALARRENEVKNAHITTWAEASQYMVKTVESLLNK